MPSFAQPRDISLHFDFAVGKVGARPIVFANSLGTDLRIWDDVRRLLNPDIPVLTLDKRGHGLTQSGSTDIQTLARDAADMMDHLGLADALICGVSVGGMIAQALAASRKDLVSGLMLCNTGVKIGDVDSWNQRINSVSSNGLDTLADGILERWFSPVWREANPVALAGWRAMLTRTAPIGYASVCAAIRDADLSSSTKTLTMPALCVAGGRDGATPPAIVRNLADLIQGADFVCLEDVGHLPCIEAPDQLAVLLNSFYRNLL
jgi:3-oxoadipate enol-lactonase